MPRLRWMSVRTSRPPWTPPARNLRACTLDLRFNDAAALDERSARLANAFLVEPVRASGCCSFPVARPRQAVRASRTGQADHAGWAALQRPDQGRAARP